MPIKIQGNLPINKPEVAKYDVNNDGKLQPAEAAKAISETLGIAEDQVQIEGGKTNATVVVYDRSQDEILRTWAPNWKGDFNITGRGAGNVCTGREFANGRPDATNVLVNCDLIEKAFLDENLASATMVVMPKGDESAAVEVPMKAATAPGYDSCDRGGGRHHVPDKKFLAASVDTAGLRDLAGDGDLKFYVRLQTKDGQTLWINKDGQAYKNFEISASELTPRGDL